MARADSKFLALLRGINVGGKNIIAKDDLRKCFEDLGLTNVRTYIQSGNVLFLSPETKGRELTALIEEGLSKRFSYKAQAIVLSHRKYKSALQAAPGTWGKDDDQKHNALFTLNGTTPKKVMAQLSPPKADIETVTSGPGVIFWSVSKKQLTKTTFMKLAKEPVYQQMTIRNHNTVFKLLELFEEV
ncbi:MAG: DUF1697 domain-containing protein [Pirellulaceae bacterium]|nr:DUF1697 domain-containing protein [Pirellulaceae bacterium]